MTIKLTPLIGAHDSTGILSYLLEIDEGRILLDCGCPDRPTLGEIDGYLDKLAELTPTLDLVLLSHPLLSSLGLVPLLRSRLGLRCPIYATLPTKEMGRWAAEEWIGQRALEESNGLENISQTSENPALHAPDQPLQNLPVDPEDPSKSHQLNDSKSKGSDHIWKVSFKELRDAFDSVIAVRYSQPIHLGGKLRPLTLTAHKSGHTIGGTIWSLRSPLHTVSSASSSTLIYAPIFNHVRESHLDSAALVQATGDGSMRIGLGMSRPMVMVVGTERSLIKSIRKKDRDRVLLDSITQTLRSSRTVLIPTDASARLIELLLLLDSHWTQSRLDSFPLCLVSQTGKDVVTFIRSLTEWMSPALARSSFDQNKRGGRDQNDQGPLRLRHIRFFNSIEALEAELPIRQPKVILAVPLSMEYGFSRAMFTRIAGVEGNLILLTSPPSTTQENTSRNKPDRLLDQLASIAAGVASQKRDDLTSTPETELPLVVQVDTEIDVELRRKVILEGEELEQYLEEERRAQERKAKAAAMLARSRQLMEDEESDESGSESESETDAMAVAKTLTGAGASWDEFVDEKEPMAFDIYVKGGSATRFSGGRTQTFRMFPVVERRRKVDGFGEVIDVDGWLKRGDAVDEAIQRVESGGRKAPKEDLLSLIPVDPPSKFVANTETILVKCNVLTIDLEGKADGRALKTIIPQINPKTVVLINGTTTSHADFAESVAGLPAFTKQVFSPKVGEQGTFGHDTKSFSVRLGDSIMSSLRFSEVEGFDVAYISGNLEISNESSIPTLERNVGGREPPRKLRRLSMVKPTNGKEDGSLVPKEGRRLEPLASIASGSAIFIGDLRLAGLKSYLISNDIPAEFVAEGVLVCGPVPISKCTNELNSKTKFISSKPVDLPDSIRQPDQNSTAVNDLVGGTVSVRKSAKGQLVIDGSMGLTFFAVRAAVYHLHAKC
ncbi:hypothetical protein Pst134EA_000848 [Puccinia striiformis f. sp. tritici]|uniref:hypothetical protein n=1 Tax=Puccinia striiformis f. sp. tritici TaxID=168172 RepID=UPI00200822C9|nr:hypothetical protein Pst134EA_000848 [Puccinia striiformis f. sp. tritici]KAH9467022.1 hypothetical protein Pst134EB_002055 [Puccinia striiformis f. sp. tritici]KAH9473780.1 hypothetical protein Pst134EA_000848 [Puccinia striiformis f. sp. tritici]KAI9600162.1 hypothetical protein KEM48_000576 [Puccinia striiformis f. sp. tritici PST-130]